MDIGHHAVARGPLGHFGPDPMFSLPRRRALLPLAGISAALLLPLSSAQAIQPPDHATAQDGRLELRAPTKHLRAARSGDWRPLDLQAGAGSRARALVDLDRELGGRAWARFDADTGALDTLIPAGFSVPGASASAIAAENFASDFIARHHALFAPGSSAGDFVLVSDVVVDDVRSLGFVQTHAGRSIVGAQLSFHFKRDRLIAARAQTLPVAAVPAPASSALDGDDARLQARAWIRDDFAPAGPDTTRADTPLEGPMLLPLVAPGGALEFREVYSLEVRSEAPRGHWRVYVDASSGAPVARESLLHWAGLRAGVWTRSPIDERTTLPLAHLKVLVDGEEDATTALGELEIPGLNTPTEFELHGIYGRVFDSQGPTLTAEPLLSPSSVFTWDFPDDPALDAQLNAYVHTQIVKDYVLGVDPEFAPPLSQTQITVNISDVCNAFADGNTLNFFLADPACQNSALIADVVYHEYGHVAHVLGLIPGVGLFDGALSEGVSDYLSATIVDDSAVGRGFFYDETPIRELDPPNYEWRWPEDTGEVHDEGRIIGGALWDLRKAMIAKHGYAEGVARTDHIWLASIQRAVDIPSVYLEALIANDDDGNLQNGTPDVCEINEAFAIHGLYDPPTSTVSLESEELADGSVELLLDLGAPFTCADVDPSAELRWRPRPAPGTAGPAPESVTMEAIEPNLLRAVIPSQPEFSVLNYQVELDWGNGTVASYPDNPADPWYERFVGEVEEIYCTSFEGDPKEEGWVLEPSWDHGAPQGVGGDPDAAYEGSQVVGVALDLPGTYPTWNQDALRSPVFDVAGHEVVRLQYRRWLNVEDGYWDQASILANGEPAWQNRASESEMFADIHHLDNEWRFHDVELTDFVDEAGELQLRFSTVTDGGLEFGGWTIDELCIVGHGDAGPGTGSTRCGDGVVQTYEQCDDGNLANGDGCSSGCLFEEADEPLPIPDPSEDGAWSPEGRGCGCASEPDAPGGAAFGALILLALCGLRRRARA